MRSVFPLDLYYGGLNASEAAVAAARLALEAVERLTDAPELSRVPGWSPLRSGIGLHVGKVFSGNIG